VTDPHNKGTTIKCTVRKCLWRYISEENSLKRKYLWRYVSEEKYVAEATMYYGYHAFCAALCQSLLSNSTTTVKHQIKEWAWITTWSGGRYCVDEDRWTWNLELSLGIWDLERRPWARSSPLISRTGRRGGPSTELWLQLGRGADAGLQGEDKQHPSRSVALRISIDRLCQI
jgi:hypothetical protein